MDIVCFSHLRWNFVYQRPQHLMRRFAKEFRCFYIEEPIFNAEEPRLTAILNDENIWVVTPHLSPGFDNSQNICSQQKLLEQFFENNKITEYIAWYYTPMALDISRNLVKPVITVYDCMDELSNFKNAPPELKSREATLLQQSDIVFTGGYNLYEAKKHTHTNIHPFPSSIDKSHFAKARQPGPDPEDQKPIPHPRIGFFGVIDERMDLALLEQIAKAKPAWQLVIVGPVVKIDPQSLPRYQNIFYPGGKSYDELPGYLRGWDVAILPFAINDATKFISPTKTPEYLAGGKPVVSTPITDVIHPYGELGLAFIGRTHDEFIEGIEKALDLKDDANWLTAVDSFLQHLSWDKTWDKMMHHITSAIEEKKLINPTKRESEHV